MRATSVLILVALGLAGCTQPPASTPVPTPTPVVRQPPTPVSSVPPGSAQVIVNGETGPTEPVVCTTDDGLTTISIGESSLGVSVVVSGNPADPEDPAPGVRSVSIGDVGGVAIGYAEGTAARAPSASRHGVTLIVTGSGSGTDSADPARIVDSTYQIAVACP